MQIERSGATPDSEEARRRAKRIYYATQVALAGGFLAALALPARPMSAWCHGGLQVLLVGLAPWAATWACRLAGVSQETRSTEIIHRDARAALAPHLSEAPEFEMQPDLWIRKHIDREGITLSKKQRVQWSDVEVCTAEISRDAIGRATTTLTLQGRDNRVLLHFAAGEPDAAKLLSAVRFYLRAESSAEPR